MKPIGSYSWFKLAMNKYWYPFVTRRWDQDDVVFLNWGYEEDPPLGLPLAPEDEKNRWGIQLYHRTATQTDLTGKKVLEPSCGHGGGGAYVDEDAAPGLLHRAGLQPRRRRLRQAPVSSYRGWISCTATPRTCRFPTSRSTRCSTSRPRTPTRTSTASSLRWSRVLRPGGHFLYADFRGFLEYDEWDAALAALPMRMESKREINPEVLRGLDNNSGRYLELVGSRLPVFLQPFGKLFAGAPDTLMYKELQRGTPVVPDVPLHQRLTRGPRVPWIPASPVRNARGSLYRETGGHCSPQDTVSVIDRSMQGA